MNKRRMLNVIEAEKYVQTQTRNAVKCSHGKSESSSHRMAKCFIANYLWSNNIQFSTEVVFRDNQRADILIPEWELAIEILHTEKPKDFLNKSYPVRTMGIRAEEVLDDMPDFSKLLIMMNDLKDTNGDGYTYYNKKLMEE